MKRSHVLVALIFFLAGLLHSTAFSKTNATANEKKLITAAEAGDLTLVKSLVKDKKIDINAKDQTGATALMLAAINGNDDVVNVLIKHKANLELKSNEGETALSFAVSNDNASIAKKLITAGADTNIILNGDEGDNILMRSILADKDLSQLIIQKNQKLVNKKNKLGETALFTAARYGTATEIDFLIKNGAQKDIKNNEGKTALIVAKEAQNKQTQKSLEAKK